MNIRIQCICRCQQNVVFENVEWSGITKTQVVCTCSEHSVLLPFFLRHYVFLHEDGLIRSMLLESPGRSEGFFKRVRAIGTLHIKINIKRFMNILKSFISYCHVTVLLFFNPFFERFFQTELRCFLFVNRKHKRHVKNSDEKKYKQKAAVVLSKIRKMMTLLTPIRNYFSLLIQPHNIISFTMSSSHSHKDQVHLLFFHAHFKK